MTLHSSDIFFPSLVGKLSQEQYDKLALSFAVDLAKKHKPFTYPNPSVGCLIVKEREVLGFGYHPFPGQGHAEVQAINSLKAKFPNSWQEKVAGSTVYVSLEPCSHYGRTPPCAQLLLDCKIARLVYAQKDHTAKVNGKGIELLSSAGVEVSYLPNQDAIFLNQDFFYLNREEVLPYIRIKLGASLDGKVALANGKSQWITNPLSRSYVQVLRNNSDAILCSATTVVMDNATYNVRPEQFPEQLSHFSVEVRQPKVIVIDNEHLLTKDLNIFQARLPKKKNSNSTSLPSKEAKLEQEKEARKERAIAQEFQVTKDEQNSLEQLIIVSKDPHPLKKELKGPLFIEGFDSYNKEEWTSFLSTLKTAWGINDLLIETGPTLVAFFLNHKLFHELHYFQAPKILGPGKEALQYQYYQEEISACPQLQLSFLLELNSDIYSCYLSNSLYEFKS